ncbi:MAG: orotate phosphoribosyltransferase [Clostridia bacterium]|nr:orotate phosphoribosyltransferase [Clostridia bacterium]
MHTEEQVLEIFEENNVLQSGHFILTSGLHSDRYAQCARIFEYPEIAQLVCADLVEKLGGVEADLVMGAAVGGITMAYEMARELGIPNIFAEREHGELKLRRGFSIPEGARVLLVEDVVTTAKTVREMLPLIENTGATVAAVACIFDRTGGSVDFGVPFVSEVKLDVRNHDPADCPMCQAGSEAVEPGSRHLHQ